MVNQMRQWLQISTYGQDWPLTFDQGHTYETVINIFLSNHKANWTQITYGASIRWDFVKWLYGLDHMTNMTVI